MLIRFVKSAHQEHYGRQFNISMSVELGKCPNQGQPLQLTSWSQVTTLDRLNPCSMTGLIMEGVKYAHNLINYLHQVSCIPPSSSSLLLMWLEAITIWFCDIIECGMHASQRWKSWITTIMDYHNVLRAVWGKCIRMGWDLFSMPAVLDEMHTPLYRKDTISHLLV